MKAYALALLLRKLNVGFNRVSLKGTEHYIKCVCSFIEENKGLLVEHRMWIIHGTGANY